MVCNYKLQSNRTLDWTSYPELQRTIPASIPPSHHRIRLSDISRRPPLQRDSSREPIPGFPQGSRVPIQPSRKRNIPLPPLAPKFNRHGRANKSIQ